MITILGSGGHGFQSLSQFIADNSNNLEGNQKQNLKNTWQKPLEFNFILATTDWGKADFGGFNGTWGRILEFFEEGLNRTNNEILHSLAHSDIPPNLNKKPINSPNYEFPVLPFGDVNKIIGYFWTQSLEKELEKINSQKNLDRLKTETQKLDSTGALKVKLDLDLRSDDLVVLLDLWHRINYTIEPSFAEEFENYLSKAVETYLKARDKLNLKARNPSLLHFWHTFLFYKCHQIYFKTWHQSGKETLKKIENENLQVAKNLEIQNEKPDEKPNENSEYNPQRIFEKTNQIFNNLCHSFGILPKNISVSFGDYQRRILVGSDGKLTIIGEENLDEWNKPILPQTLEIMTKNLEKPLIYKPLLETLENSEFIILPTGSVANWLGFVNNLAVLEILKQKNSEKKLIWIQNNEQNTQEFSMEIYQEYLESLELKPIIIETKNLQKDKICEFVKDKLNKIIKYECK